MQIRRTAAALTSAAAMSLTGVAMAAPASAAPVAQDGLVNVAVNDVIVQLPIGIAANVCDVPIAVLSRQTVTGPVDCTSVAEPGAVVGGGGGGGGGGTRQEGLVNVAVQDITVQAPIGVAANICGLPVAVLAEQVRDGDTTCNAVTEPIATA